ncbi:hypothetical protein GCM10009557_19840 [Virgisporangium ochraceum]|uniref:AbiEi antitoxin C-terminal domain-containing protein n=1 Tax=Virgisporangium ochraceum TaxID=65505 RepID=A0A8J4EC83_9ACTN|nr:type IV toxin-antitoxin system AbiEi family antitoxin [Virgisporangium ochraceum]GIJ69369.1 hypothetical protein Voc01_042860 [Virgisporangium ochraceum]
MGEQIYRYRQLREAGVSRRQLRTVVDNGGAVRLGSGVYGSGPAEWMRDVRALVARLPTGTALGYQSAAALYGFGPAVDTLHVIVPVGTVRPRIAGVTCHEAVLPVAAPVTVAGVPCSPPARCAIDLARSMPRMHGLATLDAALRSATCTADDLPEEVGHHAALRGVRRARELVGIADGRAECPQESHLRLVVIDGGLPVPEPQLWVCDPRGRHMYRLDLGYREQKVGLEYEGRSHLTTARLDADRSRMNWLSAQGWAMRYFTARDVYSSPGLVVATVRAALAA